MSEYYFLYYEELDWCTFMHKAGFSIWYEPQAVVGHKESASVGLQSPLQVYFHTRNRLILPKEHCLTHLKGNVHIYISFLLLYLSTF